MHDTSQLSRREVIRRAMTACGAATVIGSTSLLNAACASASGRDEQARETSFSAKEIAWLDEVAETILPATDTPGASAAQVGAFIALMVTDTYAPEEQQQFRAGMQDLEARSVGRHQLGFMDASPAQRLELLQLLDREQFETAKDPDAEPHYFNRIKGLTLLGYFTSQIGYTQALRYIETPGRYDPCVDYVAGERLWARHA